MANPLDLVAFAKRAWEEAQSEYGKTSQPLKERATILPFGQYEDGSVGLAWPGILAAPAEGTVNFGRYGYDTPEAIRDNAASAFDVAGGAVTGGLGVGLAGGLADDAVGIFGGRLAKTADQNALARAEKMAAEGAPREQIWNDTGWFQGVDGKWRFEIDDSKAFIKGGDLPASDTASRWGPSVASAFYHPELVKAYPELADVRFAGHPGKGGFYERNLLDDGLVSIGDDYRGKAKDSVALHESQHVIQDLEGHSLGAGANLFTQQSDAELAAQARSWRQEMERHQGDLSYRDNLVAEEYAKMGAPDWVPPREARDVAMDYGGNPTPQLEEIIKLYGLDRRTTPYSPREMYSRTAGEAEARAVQTRIPLTPEQRRARPPWLDYDVPEADQIVRFANAPTGSSVPLAGETQDTDPALLEYLRSVGLY